MEPKQMNLRLYQKAIIFLFILFNVAPSVAGQTIALIKDEKEIHPNISANSKTDVIQITLKLELDLTSGAAAPVAATNMPVVISSVRTPSVNPVLIPGTIVIQPADWQPGKKIEVEKTIVLQTSSVTTFGNDEFFYVVLNAPPGMPAMLAPNSNNLQIKVTKSGVYDYNKPFWVEVGANFDLVDGLEPNNFFTGVFFYKRDIRPLSIKRPAHDNVAVFAGVFESKTITTQTDSPLALRKYYDVSSIIPGDTVNLNVYTAMGEIIARRTVRNVSLFYSPQVRISNGGSNSPGLHFFLSFWAELQWQRILYEKEFKQLALLDTSPAPIKNVLDNAEFLVKNSKMERDVRSHYYGFGLPVFFKEGVVGDIVHLFINPVFGLSNQPTVHYLKCLEQLEKNPKSNECKRKWSPFYIVQFRLNEENYGIAFTGEVRGLIKTGNQPFVSLSLTKKFDLTKFIEFNKN